MGLDLVDTHPYTPQRSNSWAINSAALPQSPGHYSPISIPQHLNMNKLLLFIFILKSLDVSESVVGGRKTKANKYPWLAYLEVLGHDGKVGTFLRFSNLRSITWPGISVWRNHPQLPPHPHCGPLPHGQVRQERKVRRMGQNFNQLSVFPPFKGK